MPKEFSTLRTPYDIAPHRTLIHKYIRRDTCKPSILSFPLPIPPPRGTHGNSSRAHTFRVMVAHGRPLESSANSTLTALELARPENLNELTFIKLLGSTDRTALPELLGSKRMDVGNVRRRRTGHDSRVWFGEELYGSVGYLGLYVMDTGISSQDGGASRFPGHFLLLCAMYVIKAMKSLLVPQTPRRSNEFWRFRIAELSRSEDKLIARRRGLPWIENVFTHVLRYSTGLECNAENQPNERFVRHGSMTPRGELQ